MDAVEILRIAISWLVPVVLGGVVGWATAFSRKQKEENRAMRSGVRALLYDRIVQGYLHFHDELGYMPLQAKESMQDVFDSYKRLNGNGLGEQMYNKMQQLPTSKNRKEV